MAHRLDYSWLELEYPKRGKQVYRKLIPLDGLLQKNYGKRLDCTLTSLACVFGEKYTATLKKSPKNTATTATNGAPIRWPSRPSCGSSCGGGMCPAR